MRYYVDTCIWLNLFKKEGDASEGTPYWKIAEEFLKRADNEKIVICYSRCVLKELKFQLSADEFKKKQRLFKITPNYQEIFVTGEDVESARKIESEIGDKVSFYDLLHLVLSKRIRAVLITRDNLLLEVAKNYSISAQRPEDVL